MFKKLKEENQKLAMANKELRHENEELNLKLYNREKYIDEEKKSEYELLYRLKSLAVQNCYGNEKLVLRKINELVTAKLN